MQYLSHENEFDLHKNELTDETHFHTNGFARGSFSHWDKEQLENGPFISFM